MPTTTSYSDFTKLAQQAPFVVVYQRVAQKGLSASQLFQRLCHGDDDACLLEFSVDDREPYTFIGLNPMAELLADHNQITLTLAGTTQQKSGDPLQILRQLRQQCHCACDHGLTKLTGSAVGYLGYGAVRYYENIPDRHHQGDIPTIDIKFYQNGISIDRQHQEIIVSHAVKITGDLEACYQQAIAAIDNMIKTIHSKPLDFDGLRPSHRGYEMSNDDFCSDISDEKYMTMVNQAKHYINNGDAFQIVVSRQFSKSYTGSAFNIYRALKKLSPSPYHFYLQNKILTVTGASPEKVLSIYNNRIISSPLAGTRPRNKQQNDQVIAQELINDPKEKAEHMMLVDLARNDVGSVSQPGSVNVTTLMKPLLFSHVIHIGSDIEGQLAKNYDVIDALKASFPAGTLSGAPKVRAMEIIDEIEQNHRHLYSGAVIAIDHDDNLDSCIIIRSALIKDNQVSVRAGAGIVHDSNPICEANETRHKAQSVISAVHAAEGGLI